MTRHAHHVTHNATALAPSAPSPASWFDGRGRGHRWRIGALRHYYLEHGVPLGVARQFAHLEFLTDEQALALLAANQEPRRAN